MVLKRDRFWKRIIGLFCLTFIIVSCDDDDQVTMADEDDLFNEFNETTFLDDRDINDDNRFDNNEFNQSFFDAFDMNRNGFIEEDELNTSRTNFTANSTVHFNDLDANDDARLEMNEFQSDFESNNMFTEFDGDVDSSISDREFSDGVFARWDNDNDGAIERTVMEDRFNRHFLME